MQHHFDQVIKRENTSSVKWGLTKEIFGINDVLPMWVANMDFQPPQEVIQALQQRIKHGEFLRTILDNRCPHDRSHADAEIDLSCLFSNVID